MTATNKTIFLSLIYIYSHAWHNQMIVGCYSLKYEIIAYFKYY